MHHGDSFKINKNVVSITYFRKISPRNHALQMNVFGDAIRFFTNLNKEASASHILIKGTGASEKLKKIKEEIVSSENVMVAFSEIAKKVSITKAISFNRIIPYYCSTISLKFKIFKILKKIKTE